MFGINGTELLILCAITVLVVGPERLPHYAASLRRVVHQARHATLGLHEQMRAEIGPELDDVDWRKLDPRQYDPRRILQEALIDSADASEVEVFRDLR